MKYLALLSVTVGCLSMIILGPFVLIWAISILADREPIYTRWTWLAAMLVIGLMGRTGTKSKE
jgi:hypothetical protein